jgi:hypothetical protein
MNNRMQTPVIPQKVPACSLPASARLWLENFLFLTSTTTALLLLLLLKGEFT